MTCKEYREALLTVIDAVRKGDMSGGLRDPRVRALLDLQDAPAILLEPLIMAFADLHGTGAIKGTGIDHLLGWLHKDDNADVMQAWLKERSWFATC